MKKVLSIAAILLSLGATALADESGLLDKNAGIITKPSGFSVIETMDRVEAGAKSPSTIKLWFDIASGPSA